MKKILLLLLCVVLAVTMLASCDEGGIGEYEYPDFVPNYVPAITLDLYIVVGENTSDLAIDSVGRMLSQYTETKFKTSLNVHYILEAEYEKELRAGEPCFRQASSRYDFLLRRRRIRSFEHNRYGYSY